MKRKALFIINPVSGGKSKDTLPQLIEKHLDNSVFDHTIVYSTRAMHASEIAAEAAGRQHLVVAVGGDGTVNEIASSLAGTDTVLGILPFGSGNGLSRFIGIPMDVEKAIKNLNRWQVEAIDAAKLNGQWFFNMAGMGFDAHISEVFSHDKTRGFFAYVRSALQEIASYKAETYHINIDGAEYEREAFMLSFANSSQYGNNAHVSPQASVQDGLLDVCIIKPFPLYRFPEMGVRMFTKTSAGSKYVEIIRGRNIMIERSRSAPVHLDGEPHIAGPIARINVVPHALKVIVGKKL